MPTLQHRLVRTFVEMADTLVADFDVAELLFTLVERLKDSFELPAVGLLLLDEDGGLSPMASTGEDVRITSLLQAQSRIGPGFDAMKTGDSVSERLEDARSKWPEFVDEALSQGYVTVHAVPMSIRDDVIGAVVLFEREPVLPEDSIPMLRGLAEIATIAVLQHRAMTDAQETADQLRVALRTRVVLEQAKGMIAHAQAKTPDEAFSLLRGYARGRSLRLTEVARQVVEGALSPLDIAAEPSRPSLGLASS